MARYFLPPEWHHQSGIMLTWPHQNSIWAETLPAIDQVFADVATHASHFEKVVITCWNTAHEQHIHALLEKRGADLSKIALFTAPSDDVWVRDHGPITVIRDEQPVLLNFIFNGWGNKYPAQNDNLLTRNLHAQRAFGKTAIETIPFVLEGGALEVDGQGTLLTTRSNVFSKTRNPTLSEPMISELLQHYLGVSRILFLNHGALEGDDTDGHIDTLARFVNPHTLAYVTCTDKTDPHYSAFQAMEKELQSLTDYQGKPYELVPLPWPKARFADYDGRRLPVTYANFLIINGAVLVPTYEDPSDDHACDIISRAFPDRTIIPIPALAAVQWYGSLHCMTMQLPAGVL